MKQLNLKTINVNQPDKIKIFNSALFTTCVLITCSFNLFINYFIPVVIRDTIFCNLLYRNMAIQSHFGGLSLLLFFLIHGILSFFCNLTHSGLQSHGSRWFPSLDHARVALGGDHGSTSGHVASRIANLRHRSWG